VRGVGVWWRRGDLLTARQTSVRNRGAAGAEGQSTAEQHQQSRAASKPTVRTSTIISPSENCVKGSATPPDCPPHIVPTVASSPPQQHLQVCTPTEVASNLTHSSTPHASHLNLAFSNKTRPSRQQIADGPKVLVGTPSKTLPLTRPATSCLLVTRSWTFSKLVFGRLYHRDPEWVVAAAGAAGAGAAGGEHWSRGGSPLHRSIIPGIPAFPGPTRAHHHLLGPKPPPRWGPRAVEVLG
jgi:hypothetical protein